MQIVNVAYFLLFYSLYYVASAWGVRLGCQYLLKTTLPWRLCLLCQAVALLYFMLALAGSATLALIYRSIAPAASLDAIMHQPAFLLLAAVICPVAYLTGGVIFIRKRSRTDKGSRPGLIAALSIIVLGWLVPMVCYVPLWMLILYVQLLTGSR